MRYAHTNIVARDWKLLADFYCAVFECVPIPPQRDQSGDWLDKGTGLTNAHLRGMHLLLPGYGKSGPTLEIYQYTDMVPAEAHGANKQGLTHIAFEVENVEACIRSILKHGGSHVGRISNTAVKGVGTITFAYMADPEGNILEIQHWDREIDETN